MLSVAIAVALVAPASGDLRGTDAVARSIVYDGFALPAREDSVPLSRSLTGRSMAGRLQETVRALARAFRVPSVPQRARRARTAGVRVLVITWLGIWPRSSTRGGSLLGAAHLALDVAGAVPVVGEPADLANAAIYAAEGDATMATLSAGAAVPIAGWGATGTKAGIRVGDEVGDAAGGGNTVYRGLAEGEDAAAGLTARNPGAGNDIASHVAGARNSQWISATKDLAIAQERFGKHGVVAIDFSKVPNPIADLSGGIPGMNSNYMLSRWARKNQEVVIQGRVPADAVRMVR